MSRHCTTAILGLPLVSCAFIQSKLPASIAGGASSGDVIETSLADAKSEVAFVDSFGTGAEGRRAASAEWLPRQPDGSMRLRPGLWEYAAQSYCLHAGTHAPSRGDGYLYAPLHGPTQAAITHILQRSVAHPEISQQVIQKLIWSILARVKVDHMGQDEQLAAAELLEPGEILEVNGGALGMLVPDATERLVSALPVPARAVFEAENRMHDLILQGRTSYEELESVAVLAAIGPRGAGSRDVPDGRWSWHPDGYFVSYEPSGYLRLFPGDLTEGCALSFTQAE